MAQNRELGELGQYLTVDTSANSVVLAPNNISLSIGNTATFTNGGFIGIGTTSPAAKLDLRGVMQIGGSGLNQTTMHFVSNSGANGMLLGRGYYSNNQNDFFIYDQSASQMRLYVDPSGRITKPYQPMFHASLSSGDISAAQWVKFNTINWNIGSHYSSSTGYFTAPVSGYYAFLCTCLSTSGGTTEIALYKNGATILGGGRTSGAAYAATPTADSIIYLASGDYAGIYLTSGSIYGGGVYSYFSGYLLG